MTRDNLQIKVGTYTGNGTAREITGVGFEPDFIIVKGGANDAVVMTKRMVRSNCSYLSRASADVTTGIIQIANDGFYVGTGVTANENLTVYYYLAIKGSSSQSLRTGKYIGTGADDRNYTGGLLDFTPDLVWIKDTAAQGGFYRTSDMTGDNSMRIDAGSGLNTNHIQSLISNGFQLGTGSGVNTSGDSLHFLAMKQFAAALKTFTYTGNGIDSRSITGIGFQPDFVLVSANGAFDTMIRTSDMVGDTSGFSRNTAFAANHIQALSADGFQVGSSDNVNKDTVAYYGFAFKEGDFNVPITRTAI